MTPSSLVPDFFHGGGEAYTELKRRTATNFEERMRLKGIRFTLASRRMESEAGIKAFLETPQKRN